MLVNNIKNIVVGRKPLLEAIKSGVELERIYIAEGIHGGIITEIYKEARKRKIRINEVPSQKISKFTRYENTQGVIGLKSIFGYSSFEDIMQIVKQKSKDNDYYPLILILEQIQDTHNLGAILRTAEAAGVDGVIITIHNSAPVNETVQKTSAGAVSYLKICQSHNIANTIDLLKQEGFWILGSSLENAQEMSGIDCKLPLALIIGNEEKGLRKLTADKCDFLAKIPMKGKIQSLNVSVATGILLYKIVESRLK
ncbi:MAG: 23S rRNA (guanosine(2251)-2'-O)-methyltransferase RlmB [Melioribacteraceae bacterium]|nr:23S rRNA (guanosine(2251)-2'-O)-methyltransferase RlmB [Melioribacteraceae bacterium]